MSLIYYEIGGTGIHYTYYHYYYYFKSRIVSHTEPAIAPEAADEEENHSNYCNLRKMRSKQIVAAVCVVAKTQSCMYRCCLVMYVDNNTWVPTYSTYSLKHHARASRYGQKEMNESPADHREYTTCWTGQLWSIMEILCIFYISSAYIFTDCCLGPVVVVACCVPLCLYA